MAKKGRGALESELGEAPPKGIARLEASHLDDLANAIREARQRQADDLARAGERALDQIPRVLRGPVRRVLR